VFGIAWMRWLTGGGFKLGIGKREGLFAAASMILDTFAALPLMMTVLLISAAQLPVSPQLVGPMAIQAFMVLIGAVYLLLPDLALNVKGKPGPGLPEIVQAGGLSVGFGYVFATLPFSAAVFVLSTVMPTPTDLLTHTLEQAALLIPTTLSGAVGWGYLALVWKELKATVPAREPRAA
jgi:hypothetical protein